MTFVSQSAHKRYVSWAVDILFQLMNINTFLCCVVSNYRYFEVLAASSLCFFLDCTDPEHDSSKLV